MNVQEIALATARQLSKQPRITDWIAARTNWENPFSDERARYPYPQFERERENGAFFYNKMYGEWVTLGFDECQELLRSPDFSGGSAMTNLLTMYPYRKLSPRSQEFVESLLIFLHGDPHARLRGLISRAFTPRKVVALEPQIAEIAAGLVAELPTGGSVDLVESFTSTYPVHIIGELLGVPSARWAWLHDATTEMTKLFDPIRGFDPAEMDTVILELRGYLMALADIRRDAPTDDLITALVEVDDAGDRLSGDELVGLVGTLLFAGSETTTGLMGNSLVNLCRYPEQRAKLQAQPDLWPNAIEEFLRYDPPITFVPRTAMTDVTINGQLVKEGQMVAVMLAAANRDPRKYEDPHTLQVDREKPSPLSFGYGVHYCIGAALSRTSARIGLQAFLDAYPDYAVDPDAVTWRSSATLRRPAVIPAQL